MAGALARFLSGYSRCRRSRLWRPLAAAGVLTLALASGGCSLSYQLDSFLGADKSETTGSITPPPAAKESAELPPASDLAYARAAASEVLRRGKKDVSLPWENPRTGARGTVTPIAQGYTLDGRTCHDFLASYVNGSDEAWMQGEACKLGKDRWQVRSLRPWKRS